MSSSTYERIHKDIIFGRLAPNTKLKLGVLKETYNASVSILRESLNRLAGDGFVIAEEQRGFFVSPVSEKDLREVADLRIMLECNALRQSVQNGTTEWEGLVAAAHHKLHRMEEQMLTSENVNRELWKRYDWEFHQSLILACNSENLLKIHKHIFHKYLRYQMLVLTFRGEPAAAEHQVLYEAVLDRDVQSANKMLRKHIENGLKHALAFSKENLGLTD